MVNLQSHVVEELESHSETLNLQDFVRIVEEHHRGDGPGVDRELLAAYAEEVYFDVDLSAVDERLTDAEEWTSGRHLYEVGDGRISAYPTDWHEAISGTEDVRDVIEIIQREVTEPEGNESEAVTEDGVPEEKILRVARTVAGIDRQDARDEIKRLRENDEIEEFASQHPNSRIRLA